jgi:hypothetical protein
VYWTLASRHLISIRIPLVIKKAATPRSQDFDLSVVRDRCHANFYEKALFVKPTWGSLAAAESETKFRIFEPSRAFDIPLTMPLKRFWFLCRSHPRFPQLLKAALNTLVANKPSTARRT